MKNYDLDALLHPARAFRHPDDVVRDADLTLNEKRAILASWASDASTHEAASAQGLDRSGPLVRFDELVQALRQLDKLAGADDREFRRRARRRAIFG
jgi:hypothetical protein